MKPNSIPINWKMEFPALKPVANHEWRDCQIDSSPLEAYLGFPDGTINILQKAFELRLTRKHRWDLNAISQKDAYIKAAEIFRRGVETSESRHESIQGSYDILFDRRPLLPIGSNDSFFIVDANLLPILKRHNVNTSHLNIHHFSVAESHKTLATVAKMIQLSERFNDKRKPWIIIGGGVLADMAAFAAALIKLPFSLMPTTLLSQIDACVGGKTGVNFDPYGKNQLGLFAFPVAVTIQTTWLESLSSRDFRAGLAEAYKHALLAKDPNLLDRLMDALSNSGEKGHLLMEILPDLIKVKSEVIEIDPNESNLRATLNLGHTLGHALESLSQSGSQKTICHGEAVSLGLVYAGILSHQMGFLSEHWAQKIFLDLKRLQCLLSLGQIREFLGIDELNCMQSWNLLWHLIVQDKKNDSTLNMANWILLKEPGCCVQIDESYLIPVNFESAWNAWISFLELLDC